MADCRACGADVRWVDRADGQGRLCLDTHEAIAGERRWRLDEDGAHRVVETARVMAYPEHTTTCSFQTRR